MKEAPDPSVRTRRRVLVGLDASRGSLDALDEAVRLASVLEAELEGLFVEDETLFRLAGLPFAGVIDLGTGERRDLSAESLCLELRVQAGEARKALELAARERSLNWTFRVARGMAEKVVLEAARGVDLVSLGFVGRRACGGAGAGSVARELFLRASGSVLLHRQRSSLGAPVVLCVDAASRSELAASLAASLASEYRVPLRVIVLAANSGELERIRADLLTGSGLDPESIHVEGVDRDGLARALREACGGVLVVTERTIQAGAAELADLLENCACSILLVR